MNFKGGVNVRKQNNKKRVYIGLICSIVIIILSSIGTLLLKGSLTQGNSKYTNNYETNYDKTFFDNLEELNINETYINVKKDGKWGYINSKGKTVIDFKYDYCTPFKKIEKNGKKFEVALVLEASTSSIILKDEREVLSYKTKPNDDNHDVQYLQLMLICDLILEQPFEYNFEIMPPSEKSYKKIDRYEDDNQSDNSKIQIYRYDYTSEYDIVITKTLKKDISLYDNDYTYSNEDYDNKYELVKKTDENSRIVLECNNIQHNDYEMEIFKNDYIPYYDIENEKQGWFTPDGNKVSLSGKLRVLDFIDDYILIKNYENDRIFFINNQRQIVSPQYKEIYILEDRYIVKNENNKCTVINKNFETEIDQEYDIILPQLHSIGLYICANINNQLIFDHQNYAENIKYQIIDLKGNAISAEFYQQVYSYPPRPQINDYNYEDYEDYEDSDYYNDIQLDTNSTSYQEQYNKFIEELCHIRYFFAGYDYYPNDPYYSPYSW